MTYIPKHFTKEEVFHPSFIEAHGDAVWQLKDGRIWAKLDSIREDWGKPIWINRPGIRLIQCGVRPIDTKVGAEKSRHKLILPDVQAFDLSGKDAHETFDLYHWCCNHWYEYNIHRIEDHKATPSWCHIEIGIDPPRAVKIFMP